MAYTNHTKTRNILEKLDQRPRDIQALSMKNSKSVADGALVMEHAPSRMAGYLTAAIDNALGQGFTDVVRLNDFLRAISHYLDQPLAYERGDVMEALIDGAGRLMTRHKNDAIQIVVKNVGSPRLITHLDTTLDILAKYSIGQRGGHTLNVINEAIYEMDLQQRRQGDHATASLKSSWRAIVGGLIERGVLLNGERHGSALELACQTHDNFRELFCDLSGSEHRPYLPIEVLLECGADWRSVLDGNAASEASKDLIRRHPIVKRQLLADGLGGDRGDAPKRKPQI